jgi:hypothetical protein
MYENITVEKALDRATNGDYAIINDGKIVGFEQKEIAPSETFASSGAIR